MLDARVFHNPVVKRTMIFELERAKRMSYALHGIAYGVREIVHRVNAPFVARSVVRRAEHSVNYGVAHIYVRRSHIDFGAERLFAVLEFAVLHPLEKPKVFFYASVSPRAFFTGFGKRSAVSRNLFRRPVADESLSVFDEFYRPLVNLVEKVGVSLTEAVDFASANPAKNLGIYNERGSIEVGKRADITVLDKDYNVLYTVVGGNIVYKR